MGLFHVYTSLSQASFHICRSLFDHEIPRGVCAKTRGQYFFQKIPINMKRDLQTKMFFVRKCVNFHVVWECVTRKVEAWGHVYIYICMCTCVCIYIYI